MKSDLVPASPGVYVIDGASSRRPVIAWRITDDGGAVPVTFDGRAEFERTTILMADGTVIRGRRMYPNIAAVARSRRRR